jgi:excisionase family DNA binding protein
MRTTKPAAAAPDAVEPIFLTLKDAAIRLRCSPKTIRRRVKAGLIRATSEGGRKLIAIEDFYAYIERLRRDRKRP